MPPFTSEGQQVFMATVFALHTGETVDQIAVEMAVNHLLKIKPPKFVLP